MLHAAHPPRRGSAMRRARTVRPRSRRRQKGSRLSRGSGGGARFPDGDSQPETFVALKWFNDNWRWQDVPFYLRTGTCLPVQASEISIQFRAVPHQSFPPEASLGWQASRLILAMAIRQNRKQL